MRVWKVKYFRIQKFLLCRNFSEAPYITILLFYYSQHPAHPMLRRNPKSPNPAHPWEQNQHTGLTWALLEYSRDYFEALITIE